MKAASIWRMEVRLESGINNYEFMRKDNIVLEKTHVFAIRMVKCYKYSTAEQKEFVLSKQLLKSGTSIGTNVEEAIRRQSEKDFYSKITIQ